MKITNQAIEIDHLKALLESKDAIIADKEKLIEEKERTIQLLLNK